MLDNCKSDDFDRQPIVNFLMNRRESNWGFGIRPTLKNNTGWNFQSKFGKRSARDPTQSHLDYVIEILNLKYYLGETPKHTQYLVVCQLDKKWTLPHAHIYKTTRFDVGNLEGLKMWWQELKKNVLLLSSRLNPVVWQRSKLMHYKAYVRRSLTVEAISS